LRLGDFARKKKKEGLYEVPAWRQAGRSKSQIDRMQHRPATEIE
jgi:hypothetical protein